MTKTFKFISFILLIIAFLLSPSTLANDNKMWVWVWYSVPTPQMIPSSWLVSSTPAGNCSYVDKTGTGVAIWPPTQQPPWPITTGLKIAPPNFFYTSLQWKVLPMPPRCLQGTAAEVYNAQAAFDATSGTVTYALPSGDQFFLVADPVSSFPSSFTYQGQNIQYVTCGEAGTPDFLGCCFSNDPALCNNSTY